MKIKTSISLDESVLQRADALAAADNRKRSPFLEIHILKVLDALERKTKFRKRRAEK